MVYWKNFRIFALMKLRFSIQYKTEWGESLHIVITYKRSDGKERIFNLPMQTQDGELWVTETAVMESRQHRVVSFVYLYQVEDENGEVLRREWDKIPREYIFDSSKDYIFPDFWRDIPLQYHLYTKAYIVANEKEFKSGVELAQISFYRKTIVFRVSAPQLGKGECLGLCGNHPSLGDWNPSHYLRLEYLGDYEWILSVNADSIFLPIEYKYVVVDSKTHELKQWEEGENRRIEEFAKIDGTVLVAYGDALHIKERTWRAAGVVVPVFSLRSEHSYGVGDFGDLKRMVDWAVKVGMHAIQLLPLNDTTSMHSWTDSHPYNCISVYALHPHYLDLEQLAPLESNQEMTAFYRQRRELNALGYSDYMAVDRVKTDYINKVYKEQGDATLSSENFKSFYSANKHWLIPYAAFCALRDKFGTSRFLDWQKYAKYNESDILNLTEVGSPLREAIFQSYFVQYHLHRQLVSVSEYAHRQGVLLKGDIPVGVYRDSVEVWTHPEFFNLNMQIGTPPSANEPLGQNWGFPTYKTEMPPSFCDWWHSRLRHMEQYFDAIRLDHIISFFRVWEIPVDFLFGTLGHFSPAFSLSEEEIGQYGLIFRRELFTKPFINDKILERIFGIHAQFVRENFLVRKAYNLYELKAEVNTQIKICNYFNGQNDENSQWIRDGLYQLCSDVLFLRDPYQKDMYHPRFGVFNAPVYEVLNSEEKDAFMRLYNHYFYERHTQYWKYQAQRKLSIILRHTRMMICAEDLGLMSKEVDSVLDSQRILSLEVQIYPKTQISEFSHLEANSYRSIATISTHDMAPLRLWWEENPGQVQRYYASMLQKEGRAPRHLPAHIAEEIIARHLYSPSMLCLLSIQDWLSMSNIKLGEPYTERINVPSDSYNQWKYRMGITIEQLMKEEQFCTKIKTMIERSRR